MSGLCSLLWYTLIGLFRSRAALEAEILVLRHQLNVLRRSCPKRVILSSMDRLLLEDHNAGDPAALGTVPASEPTGAGSPGRSVVGRRPRPTCAI